MNLIRKSRISFFTPVFLWNPEAQSQSYIHFAIFLLIPLQIRIGPVRGSVKIFLQVYLVFVIVGTMGRAVISKTIPQEMQELYDIEVDVKDDLR